MGIIVVLVAAVGAVALAGDHVGVPIRSHTPADGSHPAATISISITFGQAMDHASVEERLRIDPPIDGEFSWQALTVTYRPLQPLSPGIVYTVTLQEGAVSATGRRSRAYGWSFAPRPPQVVYLAPTNQTSRSLWSVGVDRQQEPVELFHSEWGIYDFAVRPDGGQIAVTIYTEDATSDIWVMNIGRLQAHLLIDCSPGSCSGPAWSPDGTRLAYERADLTPTGDLGPSRVWLFDIASASTAPVFEDNQVLGFGPTFSPDGSRLVFFDGREGVIRVVDLNAGGSVLIPSAMGQVGDFSFDGQSMVYVDIRQVGAQFFAELYLADFGEQTGLLPLFESAEEDQWPAWSPIDNRIAFGRRRLDRASGFGSQLFIFDRDSETLDAITDDPVYNNLEFRWDPTGRYILFTRFNLEVPHSTPELWVFDTWNPETPPRQLVSDALAGDWLP